MNPFLIIRPVTIPKDKTEEDIERELKDQMNRNEENRSQNSTA